MHHSGSFGGDNKFAQKNSVMDIQKSMQNMYDDPMVEVDLPVNVP